MHIKVTGKNFDVGGALRTRIDERLTAFRQKYFESTVHGHVTLEKQGKRFATDCTLHLATGLVIQAEGKADDATQSFEAAAEHLERQLRRYKQRLKDHFKARREPPAQYAAQEHVLMALDETPEAAEPVGLNPVVVAESATSLAEITVGEAVMQLDLSTKPFVLFRNAGNSRINIVYRRPDGHIGWIDPAPTSA